MLTRSRFLVVHGADPQKWAKRWGLAPVAAECSECGAELTTSIPFASGTLRGLKAPTCKCGNERTPYCVVRDPRHGDLFDLPRES